MVAHDAKAQDVNEIDRGQEFEDFEEDLFVSVSNGQPLEGGSGDDVIDSGPVSDQHSGNTWHIWIPPWLDVDKKLVAKTRRSVKKFSPVPK